MPRYFFNTADGTRVPDDLGVDLQDVAAARSAAITYAGEILSSEPHLLDDDHHFTVEVTADAGLELFRITVSSAVRKR
jgi:hypothetical protein